MASHYNVWSVVLVMTMACGGTMAAQPRQAVDVAFGRNYVPTWAFDHIKYYNGGSEIQLLLDKYTGTGFQSKGSYLFGHFCMNIKMVAGDSAGTVTAFYLSSQNSEHDEIDFEFLGNRSGQPYILQTNVYTGGKGDKEQRIYLWFDPTKAFHRYSVLWNLYQIVFFIDDVPIRVFKNSKDVGVKFPFNQPMKTGPQEVGWRRRIGPRPHSWRLTRASMWTVVRRLSRPSSVRLRASTGGTRRSSKTLNRTNGVVYDGFIASSPFTTIAPTELGSPLSPLSARGT